MTYLASASKIGGSTGATAKARKKTSINIAKGIAPSSGTQTSLTCPVTLGEALPRSARARLGRLKCGGRKPRASSTSPEAKMGPHEVIAWYERPAGFDLHLPPVMFSDARGVSHESLEAELSSATNPDVPEGKKHIQYMRTRAQARKENTNSALWTSKRGASMLRATHNIKQTRPRALAR